MKPLRIAMTGGRGRLAPFIAAHLCAADAEVVSFSRSAGDGFRCTSLLAQSRTLADFDVILHLGWSTVPLTSEERPGVEKTSDLPLLENMLDACARQDSRHMLFSSRRRPFMETRPSLRRKIPYAGRLETTLARNYELKKSSVQRVAAIRACGVVR
jgi:nucleoside-diphosphate-sugar epimerase